jgi:group I intron endonuclease
MDIIYLIIDTKTNLKYIGSKKNWRGAGTYYGSPSIKSIRVKKYRLQQEWKDAIKTRLDSFMFIVLESFETMDHIELLKIEKFYQIEFDAVNSDEFINATYANNPGFCGDISKRLSPQAEEDRKSKIKQSLNLLMLDLSEEGRRIKYAKYGSKNPNFGNEWTDEMKNAVRLRMLGSTPPNKGKAYEDYLTVDRANELKSYLSKLASERTGGKNSFFGKTHSPETKAKLSNARKGKKPTNTKKVSIDNKIYEGLNDASAATGINPGTIWHRIKSKNEKYKDYKYVE